MQLLLLCVARDPWESRVGVAKALEQLSGHLSLEDSMTLLKFLIPGALSDPSTEVQAAMMAAAKAAIGTHGEVRQSGYREPV